MLRQRTPKQNGKMQVGTNAPRHGKHNPAHQVPRIGPSPKILGPRRLRQLGRAAQIGNPALPQHQAARDLGSRQPARRRRVRQQDDSAGSSQPPWRSSSKNEPIDMEDKFWEQTTNAGDKWGGKWGDLV